MVNGEWMQAGLINVGDTVSEITSHSQIRSGFVRNLLNRVLEKTRGTLHLFKALRECVAHATTGNQEDHHQWWRKGAAATPGRTRGMEQGNPMVGRHATKDERVAEETEPLPAEIAPTQ